MKQIGLLHFAYISFFSKPAHHRHLYTAVRRRHPKTIVEIGVGDMSRTTRVLQLLLRETEASAIRYFGIDLFEARGDGSGLTLKEAHRRLSKTGIRVKLIPGDPFSALARTANSMTGTDLLIVGAGVDRDCLDRAWFYVPRMLHQSSLVMLEDLPANDDRRTAGKYVSLSLADISRRAGFRNRRAA